MAAFTSSFVSTHILGSNASDNLPPSRVSFRRPISISAACAPAAERAKTHIASRPRSFYDILGIQTGATCEQIKTAYRRLARVLHPDVATSAQNENPARDFIRVHEAYQTLSDPEKRADYDRSLFRRARPMRSPFVTSATLSRRWETDQCW
ncbi:hypothetical protein K2173_007345 [Erythroxylum novogranatense]|uniref:J domain-containing protein n=1 Tax=Erythroxylum novogranatense TaxID=1862640 RepID=A0AAV8T601_9ROSI|nr:hypothetical protein K2173_007345 [Erythroxylum novogranatense]